MRGGVFGFVESFSVFCGTETTTMLKEFMLFF